MNNEEILRTVQAEPKKTGEYEREIARKGIALSLVIGVIMCAVMVMIELFIFKKIDCGKPAIILAMGCCCNLYEGCKTKTKKMVISGCIEAIIAIIAILLYIGALLI